MGSPVNIPGTPVFRARDRARSNPGRPGRRGGVPAVGPSRDFGAPRAVLQRGGTRGGAAYPRKSGSSSQCRAIATQELLERLPRRRRQYRLLAARCDPELRQERTAGSRGSASHFPLEKHFTRFLPGEHRWIVVFSSCSALDECATTRGTPIIHPAFSLAFAWPTARGTGRSTFSPVWTGKDWRPTGRVTRSASGSLMFRDAARKWIGKG